MGIGKSDWMSTAMTLLVTAGGYFLGGTAVAVLCLIVGILIVYFLHSNKSKEDKILLSLIAIILAPMFFFSIVGHSIFYKPEKQLAPLTPENARDRLKILFSDAGYSCSPIASELYVFYFECPIGGQSVGVGEFKSREDSLLLSIGAYPTQDEIISLKKMQQMQPSEAHKLLQDIRIETARLGFGYDAKRRLEEPWLMTKSIHIDDEMKGPLLDTIQRLASAVTIVQQTINKRLSISSDLTP